MSIMRVFVCMTYSPELSKTQESQEKHSYPDAVHRFLILGKTPSAHLLAKELKNHGHVVDMISAKTVHEAEEGQGLSSLVVGSGDQAVPLDQLREEMGYTGVIIAQRESDSAVDQSKWNIASIKGRGAILIEAKQPEHMKAAGLLHVSQIARALNVRGIRVSEKRLQKYGIHELSDAAKRTSSVGRALRKVLGKSKKELAGYDTEAWSRLLVDTLHIAPIVVISRETLSSSHANIEAIQSKYGLQYLPKKEIMQVMHKGAGENVTAVRVAEFYYNKNNERVGSAWDANPALDKSVTIPVQRIVSFEAHDTQTRLAKRMGLPSNGVVTLDNVVFASLPESPDANTSDHVLAAQTLAQQLLASQPVVESVGLHESWLVEGDKTIQEYVTRKKQGSQYEMPKISHDIHSLGELRESHRADVESVVKSIVVKQVRSIHKHLADRVDHGSMDPEGPYWRLQALRNLENQHIQINRAYIRTISDVSSANENPQEAMYLSVDLSEITQDVDHTLDLNIRVLDDGTFQYRMFRDDKWEAVETMESLTRILGKAFGVSVGSISGDRNDSSLDTIRELIARRGRENVALYLLGQIKQMNLTPADLTHALSVLNQLTLSPDGNLYEQREDETYHLISADRHVRKMIVRKLDQVRREEEVRAREAETPVQKALRLLVESENQVDALIVTAGAFLGPIISAGINNAVKQPGLLFILSSMLFPAIKSMHSSYSEFVVGGKLGSKERAKNIIMRRVTGFGASLLASVGLESLFEAASGVNPFDFASAESAFDQAVGNGLIYEYQSSPTPHVAVPVEQVFPVLQPTVTPVPHISVPSVVVAPEQVLVAPEVIQSSLNGASSLDLSHYQEPWRGWIAQMSEMLGGKEGWSWVADGKTHTQAGLMAHWQEVLTQQGVKPDEIQDILKQIAQQESYGDYMQFRKATLLPEIRDLLN
jgi:hypothetical protein